MSTTYYPYKISYSLIAVALFFNVGLTQAQEVEQADSTSQPFETAVLTTEDNAYVVQDPYEKFNRTMYNSNMSLDKYTLGPVSRGYSKIVPKPVQSCVTNIFQNLSVPYTAVNNLLQGKFKAAGQDVCRFVINSTVGLGGCIDVASKAKIPKHDEDFGQTLGKWGVKSGPFVMLPFFGPSNVRDALAKPVDFFADPLGYKRHLKVRNYTTILRIVDSRVQLQATLDMIDEVALDKYTFMRDAWSQKREADVRDADDFEGFDRPTSLFIGDQSVTEASIQAPAISEERVEQHNAASVEPVLDSTNEKITS